MCMENGRSRDRDTVTKTLFSILCSIATDKRIASTVNSNKLRNLNLEKMEFILREKREPQHNESLAAFVRAAQIFSVAKPKYERKKGNMMMISDGPKFNEFICNSIFLI